MSTLNYPPQNKPKVCSTFHPLFPFSLCFPFKQKILIRDREEGSGGKNNNNLFPEVLPENGHKADRPADDDDAAVAAAAAARSGGGGGGAFNRSDVLSSRAVHQRPAEGAREREREWERE